jgi:hypothetical protein
MSTVTAIISDTHIGSFTALSLPEWGLDTGTIDKDGKPIIKKVMATLAQLWLLDKWNDYWKYAKKLCGRKHRLVVIHLGDVIDGNHHNSPQLLPNIQDQKEMAIEILKPIANAADAFYIMRGTSIHSGPMSSDEVAIARELGAKCLFEQTFDIDGTLIQCAHHGRASKRDWTSVAASVAVQVILSAAMDRPPRQAPRYVFRGHNHICDDSGEKVRSTRAIALPSWELRTEFGFRVAPGILSDIGGAFMLPDGSLDLSRLRYYEAPGESKVLKV